MKGVDAARAFLLEMRAEGVEPDAATFTILVSALGKAGQARAALSIVDNDMKDIVRENTQPRKTQSIERVFMRA